MTKPGTIAHFLSSFPHRWRVSEHRPMAKKLTPDQAKERRKSKAVAQHIIKTTEAA